MQHLSPMRHALVRKAAYIRAQSVLESHHGRHRPIDPIAIARSLGAEVQLRTSVVDGTIEKTSKGYRIAVDSEAPGVRQRFTLAHELGHIAFDQANEAAPGFVMSRSSVTDRGLRYRHVSSRFSNETEEAFCNWFAAFLLIPDDTIEDLCNWEILSPELLRNRASTLQVSVQSFAWRIFEELEGDGGLIQLRLIGKPSDRSEIKWRICFGCFPNQKKFIPQFASVPDSSGLIPLLEGGRKRCIRDLNLSFASLGNNRQTQIEVIGPRADILVFPTGLIRSGGLVDGAMAGQRVP